MAKSLTSNTTASKDKKFGAEPINLLEIQFGGTTGTKYYSDRIVTVGANTYEALVKDWGDIDFIINKSATTSDLNIVLLNTTSSPISNIFATDTPESKIAILYQWYVGDDETDKVILFNGRVTSPVKYSLDTVKLDIVDRVLDLEKKIGTVVTKEAYPRSLPAHRGRIIPKVVGSVNNVPAVCIFTAGKSSLRESLTSIALTIEVDDGSVFPIDLPWVLVIEDEQVLMEANTGQDNTLTITTRGYNSTTATFHILGTQIYEKLSQFRYQVHDNTGGAKAANIVNVRVNGELLTINEYDIDQVTYPGQIIFTTYPQIDERRETDFDDYKFDTIINDETVPYGAYPEVLINPDNNGVAWLKSGQRIVLQRTSDLNNTNQLKRTFVEVVYSTDDVDWGNNIQASVYWNGILLGILPKPSFDPVIEELDVIYDPPEGMEFAPLLSNGTDYGGFSDLVQGPEAVIVTETYSEEIRPSSLAIETREFDPDAYAFQGGNAPGNMPPAAYFTAQTDDLTGIVLLFQHPVVGIGAETWEGDSFNFKWIDWVYSGFKFSPPTKGGTARIINIVTRFIDRFDPYTAGSGLRQYRVQKVGTPNIQIIGSTLTQLKQSPLYTQDVTEFFVVIRTLTHLSPRYNASSVERIPLIAELWGALSDVFIKVDYELIKEEPPKEEVPTVEEPITITKPVPKSHEATHIFEITHLVNDWSDLTNTDIEINFESDGTLPGTNLYIRDLQLKTESGRYTFKYTDEITADVRGYYVDGTQISTNYGTLNELITRPDQVFKFILTWNSLFTISDLDLNYYNAVSAFFDAQKYRVDFAIVEDITIRELLEKLAFQTRTDQYWEAGKHRIKVLEVESAALKEISASEISSLSIVRSEIETLVNLLEVRYNIDYSFLTDYDTNKFRGIITIENSASQTDHGVRKSLDETFFFDCIRDDVTASHVSNYYLSFYSVIRRYVTLNCFLDQLELDKHDIVNLSFPLDNLVNTPGRILSNRFKMGGTSIDQIELLVLMEDYTYHKLGITESVSFSEAIQLTIIPLISLSEGVNFSDAINFRFQINESDSVKFTESFSSLMHRVISIRDGFTGGFGTQGWGNSSWGGDDRSVVLSDELLLNKIFAIGTSFLTKSDAFSLRDVLILTLVHNPYIVDNDKLNLVIRLNDILTITKV